VAAHWYPPQTPTEIAKWDGFIRTVLDRYGSDISYLEVWNEPNQTQFWYGPTSPAQYAQLLSSTYLVAKSVSPAVSVVFGGLSRNDVGYLQAYYNVLRTSYPYASGEKNYFDILGVHPYSDNRSPLTYASKWIYAGKYGEINTNFYGLSSMLLTMAANGDQGKKIYIGEFGYSTTPYNGFPGVPDAQRAAWVSQAFSAAASLNGSIVALSWYCFFPTAVDGSNWAITGSNWSPTLTFDAIKALGLDH
jgi:hypothetical protein